MNQTKIWNNVAFHQRHHLILWEKIPPCPKRKSYHRRLESRYQPTNLKHRSEGICSFWRLRLWWYVLHIFQLVTALHRILNFIFSLQNSSLRKNITNIPWSFQRFANFSISLFLWPTLKNRFMMICSPYFSTRYRTSIEF